MLLGGNKIYKTKTFKEGKIKSVKMSKILGACLLILSFLPSLSQAEKVKLRVSVKKANIQLNTDTGSTVSTSWRAILGSEETVSPLLSWQPTYHTSQPSADPGISYYVKFSGGMNYLLLGDLNDHFDGRNKFLEDWADSGSLVGKYHNLHLGFDLGAEFIINLTPRFGIGIGSGYLQGKKKSDDIGYTIAGYFIEKEYKEWKVSAVPITMGVYYSLPMGSSMNLLANLGGGYYIGNIYYSSEWESLPLGGGDVKCEANRGTFGFHGGFSLELNVTSNMAFILEVKGRYAKFSNIEGDYEAEGWGGAAPYWSINEKRTLYYFSGDYPALGWGPTPPVPGVEDVRIGSIDLSGFFFGVGIKVKLF